MLSPRPAHVARRILLAIRASVTLGVVAQLAIAAPAVAQDPSTPQLSVAKIQYEPPVDGSSAATVKVTVANAVGRAATPSDRPVVVKIILVNPNGRRTNLETALRTSIPGGGTQTGVISVTPIYMREVGTHTVTAWPSLAASSGSAELRSPDKVEKIIVSNPAR